MAVKRKHLAHQIAHLLIAALVEDQNRRPGAAQRAAEEAGRAQSQNIVKPGNQRSPIGLMIPVFEGRWKGAGIPGGQSGDQQCRALYVKDGVRA